MEDECGKSMRRGDVEEQSRSREEKAKEGFSTRGEVRVQDESTRMMNAADNEAEQLLHTVAGESKRPSSGEYQIMADMGNFPMDVSKR